MKNSIYKSIDSENILMKFYERMLINWPVPHNELDIDIEMGKTHIIIAGDESHPPLILLHGSTSNATTWAGDIKTYAENFRVYALDMPGEPGKSFQRRLSWENDDYSKWILQVFDALKLEKPLIIGLSLGGWVTLKFAAAYPDRVEKIALIAPGGVVNPNMKAIMKMVSFASQGEKGIEKTFRLLFPEDFESQEVREFFKLINEHLIIRSEAVKPLPDNEISKVKAPVFMVCGALDAFFNFKKAGKRLKKLLPDSKTLLFEKGTHGLVSMAETIIPFLKS